MPEAEEEKHWFTNMPEDDQGLLVVFSSLVTLAIIWGVLFNYVGMGAITTSILVFALFVGCFITWVRYENAKIENDQALAAARKMYEPEPTDAGKKKDK